MIALLIYILDAIRRALQKFGRGILLVGEAFIEAQEIRRALRRPYAEE
jgi:hypothetical protein